MTYKGWEIESKRECYGHGDYGIELCYIKDGIQIRSSGCYSEGQDFQAKKIEKFIDRLGETNE